MEVFDYPANSNPSTFDIKLSEWSQSQFSQSWYVNLNFIKGSSILEQKDLVAMYQVKVIPIQLLLQSLSKHC